MLVKRIPHFCGMLVLCLSALLLVFPIYWSIAGSFMTDSEVMSIPPQLFPSSFHLGNYAELFQKAPALTWLLNSVITSTATTVLVVLFGTMAGYGFAKKRFFSRNVLFAIMLFGMMIPKQIILIPLFKLVYEIGMINTLWALIIPELGVPLGVFLMRQFIVGIPDEIAEAAQVDGMNELGIFFRVIMPISKPGMATLAIFTFISSWNDYAWQLVAVSSRGLKTLPLGIATFQQEFSLRYALLMAGGVIASLPMIALFIVFQRYFTKGIVMGAVKG